MPCTRHAVSPTSHSACRWQGSLIYLELMLKVILEKNSTITHQCLAEFLHLSMRLSDQEQLARGRGNFSEVVLLGNGLGRLMDYLGIGDFWAPSMLFPPPAREGLRPRGVGGAS